MPKTHGDLYDQIIDFDNLIAAFHLARKGKRYAVMPARFSARREEELINLHNHLVHGTWRPSPLREFVVTEPKLRLIHAPPFADRVVHHAICRVIEPLFERKFIYDSYACRKGKGHLAAAKRVQTHLRRARRSWGEVWVLKADVRRFFPSMDHRVLMCEVARTIRDGRVLDLFWRIIAGSGFDDCGMPIGSLISQLLANVLLNRLDHLAKDDCGYRYYVRYMDDFVVLAPSKVEAWKALDVLAAELEAMNLLLNPKTAIFPAQRGVDFCGYRIWATHMLPRKRTTKRARRDFRKLAKRYAAGDIQLSDVQTRVASFLAYTKHCQAKHTTETLLNDLVLTKDNTHDHTTSTPHPADRRRAQRHRDRPDRHCRRRRAVRDV